jgi:hypothetical protein
MEYWGAIVGFALLFCTSDVDLNGREIHFPHGEQGFHRADEPLMN